ncbi:MAG: hypothetical protein GY867_04960 [bacterium]|nr:hypothetical protein [bacterium]
MTKKPLMLSLVAVVLLSAVPALGDWDEGQPHKMHWPQLPDELGWGVNATKPVILADDFRCEETGFIKDIHFWGAWKGDQVGELIGFQMSFHADIPDPDGDGPLYSQPGTTIYDWFVPIGEVVVRPVAEPGEQSWYDPVTGEVIMTDHNDYYQYNLFLDEADWLEQDSGNIYWINISAEVVEGTGTWGWKSTPEHLNFNDDGVFACWGDLRWGELYWPGSTGFPYVPGDVNGDGVVDAADVTYLQNYLSGGPPPPYVLPCVLPPYYPAADVNGDGFIDMMDVIALQSFLSGGPPPGFPANYPPMEMIGPSLNLSLVITNTADEIPWDCEQNPPPNKSGGGFETEPNNSCSTPNAAACEYSYCGTIDPSGGDTEDWWQMVVPQDTCYCVDVRVFANATPGTIATGGGLDPELTVYAADCTTQLFYNNDKNGTLPQCVGTDAQYDCNDLGNCHQPGTVLNLKVSPASAADVGPYLLVINCYQCECPEEPVEDTCEYYKARWEDYAPNGVPDIDQKQFNWTYPPSGAWSYCGPVALANCLWWFDSKFEPSPVDPRPFAPGPGNPPANDGYPLLPSFDPTGLWDDHDTLNVQPFVDSLALYCLTNTGNSGTNVQDMYNGVLNWLTKTGLSSAYTVRLMAVDGEPVDFDFIREEILISQDVILLLGFYQDFGGNCERIGGHYVTCAGVCTDPLTPALCISDPYFDNNESGAHIPSLHNDTWYVSGPHGTMHHDRYDVVSNTCPVITLPPFVHELSSYPVNAAIVPAFVGQNKIDPTQVPPDPNPGLAVHTVIEYALIICPVEEEIIDSVVCEPVGGSNPPHPPTYWYDVFPNGTVGLCDFHVVVQDSIVGNYSNWVDPGGWTHLLHKVGSEWWVSWYDASCTNPLLAPFRFSFDNPNSGVWGHWTTTSGGSSDPFTGIVDSSGRHSASSDGYGYRVHGPVLPAAVYDSVVCEPQGAAGPTHPSGYWYDVIPNTAGGICDFHVVVKDSVIGNYSGWFEPAGWTHNLHKMGLEWWVSWYNTGCTSPITTLFRFGFTNAGTSTWGHWTTTVSGSMVPFTGIADSSGNHTGSAPGLGYMVHVPQAPGTTCCIPTTVGDCDQSGVVDITDVSVLVDNQFLTLTPLVCPAEGNINYPGTGYATTDTVIDITDLTILIDNQFLTLAPLPPCP